MLRGGGRATLFLPLACCCASKATFNVGEVGNEPEMEVAGVSPALKANVVFAVPALELASVLPLPSDMSLEARSMATAASRIVDSAKSAEGLSTSDPHPWTDKPSAELVPETTPDRSRGGRCGNLEPAPTRKAVRKSAKLGSGECAMRSERSGLSCAAENG